MSLYRLAIILLFSLTAFACGGSDQGNQAADQPVSLETSKDRSSYALGLDIGNNIAMGEMDINVENLIQGLRHGLEGVQPLMTEDEQFEALMALQQEFMQAQMDKVQKQAQTNLDQGLTFMEEFAELEGVMETENGVLYRELVQGTGERPGPRDVVTVHYHGTLVDGTVFDSSIERGEPATFPLDQVISGWTEVLQLMPQGAKWEVVIPPDQAYGDQQAGPVIGPNSTLVFEIELLETMKPE
ncbi:FKBP-type peptidyl-prolyl cis-trans isomerase [Desulfonatronovibrio hydrogenovorans]|uniref:FKBP-type peptidyl-prolyl cis-trans isomerase n=1 Tax=Desulfonatronovibrio hydrogenovorans TaxID=53245 RepID=UPI000491862B|nr:FKBP-type peptidyl-prolyl cis-trans isomerase [Desulfonatronovibrio hydrogenovorans]